MNIFKSDQKVPKLFGSWDNQTKELKAQFNELTDDDLKFEEGKENELIKRIELRINKTRDEVIFIINKTQHCKCWMKSLSYSFCTSSILESIYIG